MTIPAALTRSLAERYRLDREVGRGGMATVYLAQDLKHDRQVALKVLRPELAASLGSERFLREINLTARLDHPHILPLYDSGRIGGPDTPQFLYYVMPLVEGESLRDRLNREKQLPIPEALSIAREVADALGYAHDRGVVHRDIKPENILLSGSHARVADFGIARAVTEARGTALTETGLAIGTPTYMSPEQAAGDKDLDGRSDLYALGCVLYEMLAGQPPFSGPTAESVVRQHMTMEPPRVTSLRPAVSNEVAETLQRALAKNPADRLYPAARLAEALGRRGSGPSTARPEKSLAVLPFTNLSADPDNEFFSDGMTDELINALAKLEGLHVVSRTSTFAFKGRQEDIRTIGQRLNVQTVLEGSVRRAGRRLRVTAQLVNVTDGFHLWSETFDRELEDVFAIQDEIAKAITAAMEIRLLGKNAPRQRPPTEDLEAYSLYLRGRHHWNQRTEESLRAGLGFFQQALNRDPQYALAYTGVADSYLILCFYCAMAPTDGFPAAKAAALRALELDPTLVEARATLAYVAMYHEFDWAEAERGFLEVIGLNPGYATAHQWYGNFLAIQGRFEESVEFFGRAISLDPLSPLRLAARGWGCYFARRYAEAIEQARRALALDPTFLVALQWLGLACEQTAARVEALHAFEEAVRLSGRSGYTLGTLGHGLAIAGQTDAARVILAELETLQRSRYVSAYDLAAIHAALDETEAALDCLEQGYAERTHWMALLGVDPRFDHLRQLPRFRQLLGRLRLSEPASTLQR